MNVETRKSLNAEELAEKTQDYEKVLTVEPSLADALNERFRGEKAVTPLQLVEAGNYRKELFLQLVEETNLTWRQAAYLMDKVLDCWQHTGKKEDILRYERFDTEEVRTVLKFLKNRETPMDRMEEVELEGEVAVVKEHQFNDLDRKVLPENYTSIRVFTDETFELPDFNIFSSASEIAKAVKQQAEKLGGENVGVLVKPGSRYEPVVKSVLEASEIPYRKSSDLKSSEGFRTFVSILETGLREKNVRVKDVRPILEYLGIEVSRLRENVKFRELDEAEELREFLNVIPYLDYKEAAEKYLELSGEHLFLEEVLEDLGIKEEQVAEGRNNALRYYVENFPVGLEEVDEGVLLADPTEVSQVDREYVFHVGMGTDWRRKDSDEPWVDSQEAEEANLKDFKSLIQSGEQNFYMVRNKELNEEITPCLYFNSVFSQEFTCFDELPSKRVRPEEEEEGEGFERESLGMDPVPVETVSQSELNSYAISPRLYYMQRLVSEADQLDFRKGNLFHDYAEFHANNPKKASQLSLEEVVEFMLSRIEEMADDIDLEDLETEFKIGVENIREFIEMNELPRKPIEGYSVDEGDNVFVEEFGGGDRSFYTEPYVKDKELGVKGKVDLLLSDNRIVDFKSGRKKSRSKVVRKSHVDLFEEERFPDFQPLLYITYHRKYNEGEVDFTFLHFLNDLGDSINGGEAELETSVTYYPESFDERKASMEFFEKMIRDVAKSNDRRKTLEKLGYNLYSNFMQDHSVSFFDKDKALESEACEEFKQFAKSEVGDYKYVEKGVEKALKKLVDIRRQNYFKEDADRMEEFLDDKISQINRYRDERFPVDAETREIPMRDLILER